MPSLEIHQFWTFGAPLDKDWDMVTPALLEALIELFNDTIVELELGFIDNLSLPDSTIHAIGRIKNLRTLRLSYERNETFDSPNIEDDEIGNYDPDFFSSLLSAAQGLKCLIFYSFDPFYAEDISAHDLARFQLSNIKHLVADAHSSAELVLSLAVALKPTLTMVSILSTYHIDTAYVSLILKTLEDTLQGLHVDTKVFNNVSHLNFSSLRLLHIDSSKHGLPDHSKLAVFSHAPIEVLVLSSHYEPPRQQPDQTFLQNIFENFRSLKRLVFYGMDSKFSLPEDCFRLCQDHQVESIPRQFKNETRQGEVALAKEAGTARNDSSRLSSGMILFSKGDDRTDRITNEDQQAREAGAKQNPCNFFLYPIRLSRVNLTS
ncbi:hypothetical protein KEM48_003723 [Puccinia striiformis f. sp. tritici PST-130]|nr:hypothetical protein KEM48_003723 [Puccinia striiformis f. sp. tritici PST-130]